MILCASIALALAACARSPEPARGAPGAAPPAEQAVLTCQPGLRLCRSCTGGMICARQCPECPPPADVAPSCGDAPSQVAALTCTAPRRLCTGCNGGQFCALRCPECAPPAAPQPEPAPTTLALVPDVVSCGGAICAPGTWCCNPTCGICTPKGVNCTQQTCN